MFAKLFHILVVFSFISIPAVAHHEDDAGKSDGQSEKSLWTALESAESQAAAEQAIRDFLHLKPKQGFHAQELFEELEDKLSLRKAAQVFELPEHSLKALLPYASFERLSKLRTQASKSKDPKVASILMEAQIEKSLAILHHERPFGPTLGRNLKFVAAATLLIELGTGLLHVFTNAPVDLSWYRNVGVIGLSVSGIFTVLDFMRSKNHYDAERAEVKAIESGLKFGEKNGAPLSSDLAQRLRQTPLPTSCLKRLEAF